MEEPEWLACVDPQTMLDFLQDKASERKVRLRAGAWCRGFGQLLEDARLRQAVEVAERFADGLADEAERQEIEDELSWAIPEIEGAAEEHYVAWACCRAAADAANCAVCTPEH